MTTEADPASQALQSLIDRLVAGDPAALARCITLAENSPQANSLRQELAKLAGKALVLGFTGPPGVGKSTLISALITELRHRGRSVAVAAVDPSSPISGGAILGDRVRMNGHTDDPGVFIRSIASRNYVGGLSESIHWTIDAMDAAGRDVVIIETVGVGQSDVDVSEIADVCVVVNAPGLGDDIQAIKAGILEVADVLVVNKADVAAAEVTARQIASMLKLRPSDSQNIPVVMTDATSGRGVGQLCDEALSQKASTVEERAERRLRRLRRIIALAATNIVRHLVLDQQNDGMNVLAAAAAAGIMNVECAAWQVLTELARRERAGQVSER